MSSLVPSSRISRVACLSESVDTLAEITGEPLERRVRTTHACATLERARSRFGDASQDEELVVEDDGRVLVPASPGRGPTRAKISSDDEGRNPQRVPARPPSKDAPLPSCSRPLERSSSVPSRRAGDAPRRRERVGDVDVAPPEDGGVVRAVAARKLEDPRVVLEPARGPAAEEHRGLVAPQGHRRRRPRLRPGPVLAELRSEPLARLEAQHVPE